MWYINVSNHGLKLKPRNYTPKGRGAHSVEKQELSVLDAYLGVCYNLFLFHQDKDMKNHCFQKSEKGQNLVCQLLNVTKLFCFLYSCWISFLNCFCINAFGKRGDGIY